MTKAILTLIYLLIFSLSLGQLGRISLYPGVNLYIHDFIILLVLLTGAVHLIQTKTISLPRLIKPIGLFCLSLLLSLLVTLKVRGLNEVLIGSLYLWRFIAYAGIYLLISQLKLTKKTKQTIKTCFIAAGVIISLLGLFQYIFVPDTTFLFSQNWDKHYYRLIGSFFDPGFTGIMLVFVVLLTLNQYWNKLFKLKKLSIGYLFTPRSFSVVGLLAISFISLLLTYSRSSYLSLLAGLFVLSYFKKNFKPLVVSLMVLTLGIFLLPRPGGEGVRLERTQSVVDRFESNQRMLQIIKDNPIVGVGFNLLRFEKRDRNFINANWQQTHAGAGADNIFLFILATAGIIGLIALICLLFKLIRFSLRQKNYLYLSSLTATLVHGQFNNTLFYAFVMLWLWILLAVNLESNSP